MTRILVSGDPHGSSRTPQSRIDDYPTSFFAKLVQIRNLSQVHHCDGVVFLGDIFHAHTDRNLAFLNKLIQFFEDQSWGTTKKFAIAGNHDLPYDKIEYLYNTPLGTLFSSGVLKKLEKWGPVSGGWTINGTSVGEQLAKAPGPNQALFGHYFFNSTFNDIYVLDTGMCKDLGYELYCLGHDHTPYSTFRGDGFTVVRPGALMRNTSHFVNIHREVKVVIVDFKDDGTLEIQDLALDVRPSQEVFSNRALDKKGPSFSISAAVAFVEGLVKNQAVSKNSVYDWLDKLQIPMNAKYYLENKLKEAGIYRV